jgi:serine/threonine-protein kinase ATR
MLHLLICLVDYRLSSEFSNEIDIMRSLAKPRKITIRGSNGQIYMFLGKPKDDLRKDARLMDFNAIINKLLKANSESRRRQLRVFSLSPEFLGVTDR